MIRLNSLAKFAIAGSLALAAGMSANSAEAHRFWHDYYYGPPILRPVFFPRPFVPPPPPPVFVPRPIAFVPPPPAVAYGYGYGYGYGHRHHVKRVVHRTVRHRAACACNCCPATAAR